MGTLIGDEMNEQTMWWILSSQRVQSCCANFIYQIVSRYRYGLRCVAVLYFFLDH